MTREEKEFALAALQSAQERVSAAIKIVQGEWVTPPKCCNTCMYMAGPNACSKWPGAFVPNEIVTAGCDAYECDDVPF